jgi:hypothetical protein
VPLFQFLFLEFGVLLLSADDEMRGAREEKRVSGGVQTAHILLFQTTVGFVETKTRKIEINSQECAFFLSCGIRGRRCDNYPIMAQNNMHSSNNPRALGHSVRKSLSGFIGNRPRRAN